MKLVGKFQSALNSEPFLVRIEQRLGLNIFSLKNLSHTEAPATSLHITNTAKDSKGDTVTLTEDFDYLAEGDILRINSVAKEVRVLYRRNSKHNTLFTTERCNSRCLMCSQPPRDLNDAYLVEDILRIIPWMARETSELGITGGEPTLLYGKLLEIIAATKQYLPRTALHMLSNGRLFAYTRFAQDVGEIHHPDFMVGIPLYADNAEDHNFVVQAKGAFDQTIFGLLNLARAGVRVELRMVIHKQTFKRLPEFGRYVARNLPFIDQVSLMGLELTGYARSNLESLWIDPADYQAELEGCVEALDAAGLQVLLFNQPLCVLRPALRRFARKSISDWKNIYFPVCEQCTLREQCGGFFASSALRASDHIRPFTLS